MTPPPRKKEVSPRRASAAPRRSRNAELSKQQLLTAAVEVFAEHGLAGASIDDICSAADINKRMVYHYFGSKEALYVRALDYVYAQFTDVDVSLSEMLLPAEQLIEVIIRRYHEFLRSHQHFVRFIAYENLNHGRAIAQLDMSGFKSSLITALRLALQKGQDDGRFRKNIRPDDLLIDILGLSFFYFSNQHTMRRFMPGVSSTAAAMNRRIDHMVRTILHGILVDIPEEQR